MGREAGHDASPRRRRASMPSSAAPPAGPTKDDMGREKGVEKGKR